MARIHTHYDNLKVARNAPAEVIRAAYKTLSQKFHPDRNPGNAEAARIMSIINASYDVLSNPEKRYQHDLWIEQQENERPQYSSNYQPSAPAPSRATTTSTAYKIGWGFGHITRYWILYGIAALILFAWLDEKPRIPPPGPKPYQTTPPPSLEPTYVKPMYAPNGEPWPIIAGYVKGYKRLHTSGRSSITIDNGQNDSDVFVKLVSLDGPQAFPVRVFFIPAFSQFTLQKVTPGNYDIRYRSLDNGSLSRSDQFTLDETRTPDGIRFSRFTMTLYKVRDGNMKTYGLAEAEF